MLHWLIVFGYVLLMFLSAGREESSAQFTAQLLKKWWPNLDPTELRQWVVFFRKGGHVLAYAILTLIAYFAAIRTKAVRKLALPLALALSLLVAILDERYQRRLPHRSGSWVDVLIDGIGMGVMGLGIWLATRKKINLEVSENVENE